MKNNTNTKLSRTLENLNFDNIMTKKLPIDKIENNNNPRMVRGAIYSRVKPSPVKKPLLVSISLPALKLIDLNPNEISRKDFVEYFAGNKILNGSDPISHCYCGHQFGKFAGQLGDGRAITLGSVINNKAERWELQIKGAGKTPYSRDADGRAVLRSSIREFLCSEAIHSLGIPTTRAGSIITSGSKVVRDPLYDGKTKQEPCTIVLRFAPNFIRFGSFEITNVRSNTGVEGPSAGMYNLLTNLLDYLLEYYFPNLNVGTNKLDTYQNLFGEIVTRTAKLVAEWQCIGFCHGVLNTDNMSILGLTIDYGPFGFMESFDPAFVCNHSDDQGLYSYEKQPTVCHWNLTKLAEALHPVIPLIRTSAELDTFWPVYHAHYSSLMHRKLGLVSFFQTDTILIQSLFETMHTTGADFTNTFRILGQFDPLVNENDSLYALLNHCYSHNNNDNHNINDNANTTINNSLNSLLKRPENSIHSSTNNSKKEKNCVMWKKWLDKYRERLQFDVSSIKSIALGLGQNPDNKINEWVNLRTKIMKLTNPKYVLRNWMAQQAIDAAERGDYREVNKQFQLLQDPYGLHDNDPTNIKYTKPDPSRKLQVSCSS